jgi:hypothetical protein
VLQFDESSFLNHLGPRANCCSVERLPVKILDHQGGIYRTANDREG